MTTPSDIEELKNSTPIEGSALAVQSFYMTALKNHVKLSALADKKANVLLGVNALILGVVLTDLASKVMKPGNEFLGVPLMLFVGCCVITIILSIAVTRPQNTSGKFIAEDVSKGKVNLAFFGNFHSMEYQEYQDAVNQVFKSTEDIYEMLTMDLYFLGKVLDKKYRMLKRTFTFFIFGICISMISFIVSYTFYN